MKKFLLSLAAVALCLPAMAATVSVTFSDKYSADTEVADVAIALGDGVTATFAKGTGNNPPKYYANGTAIRAYGGNTLTITASGTISNIELTFGNSDGSNAITSNTGDYVNGTWTGSANSVTLTVGGTSGNRRIAGISVTYEGSTTDPDPDDPGTGDDPSDNNSNIVQQLNNGLGFPEGSASASSSPVNYTATDTNIEYTIMGCYTNNGYMMVNGKNYPGAYISWSLDMDMAQLRLTTSGGCSTNTSSKVNVYANDNLIADGLAVNITNHTFTVEIPEEYQTAGTVYKVESATTAYNQQFVSFTYVRVGNQGETPTPEVPEAPEGTITVAKALELMTAGYEGDATVAGVISQIDEISAQYGNATYYIKDALTDTQQLEVYRGKWMNGESFSTGDEIEVGGKVVVQGKLVIYSGTYEFTTGSSILSYEAPEGGEDPDQPDQPGDENTKELPLNVADATNFVGTLVDETLKDDGSLQAAAHYQPLTSFAIDGYTFEFATTSTNESQAPAYYLTPSTNANTAPTVRLYNGSSMTIKSKGNVTMKKIVFKGSNLGNNANFTVDSGTWTTQNNAVWEGEAKKITVNANATWRFTSLEITYDVTTGVEAIETEEGEAVYYNLQGVRVNNPERGIFIKVAGNKAEKVVK